MKLKILLLLLFIVINNVFLSYGVYIRILPITYENNEWYLLLGHDRKVTEQDLGWTDFNIKTDNSRNVDLALETLKKQTNNQITPKKKYFEKNGIPVNYKNGRIYFFYYNLPSGLLPWGHAIRLNREAFQRGVESPFNYYAWLPIKKIMNGETLVTKITEISKIPEGIIEPVKEINIRWSPEIKKIKTMLDNNWKNVSKIFESPPIPEKEVPQTYRELKLQLHRLRSQLEELHSVFNPPSRIFEIFTQKESELK